MACNCSQCSLATFSAPVGLALSSPLSRLVYLGLSLLFSIAWLQLCQGRFAFSESSSCFADLFGCPLVSLFLLSDLCCFLSFADLGSAYPSVSGSFRWRIRLLARGFSCFLRRACGARKLPFEAHSAAAMSFWKVLFPFCFVSRCFLLFSSL